MKNKSSNLKPRSQKEHGVFYTSVILAEKMVTESLSQLLNSWYDLWQNLVQKQNIPDLSRHIEKLTSIKICDPAVGEGVFLIAAYAQFWAFIKNLHNDFNRIINKEKLLQVISRLCDNPLSRYIFHISNDESVAQIYILTHNVYGIDIDPENCNQTIFQLCKLIPNSPESLRFQLQLQIKTGDALLSPELCSFSHSFFELHRTDLKNLCIQREKLKNTATFSQKQFHSELEYISTISTELYSQISVLGLAHWGTIPQNLRFFSWWLEFPEVFFSKHGETAKEGGFNCILSNPPWEVHQINENEFFNEHDPLYSKASRQQKEHKRKHILESPEISIQFTHYRNQIYWKYHFFTIAYQFQMEHKFNLAKLFLERIFYACSSSGRSAIIIPAGILTEERANYLRYRLISAFSVSDIFYFSNGSDYFQTIAAGQPVCLLLFSHGSSTKEFRLSRELPNHTFQNPDVTKISLPIQFLYEISPQYSSARDLSIPSIAIPRITQSMEFELLKKLSTHPKVGVDWHLDTHRELNRTDDEKNHIIGEQPTKIPVLEGKHLVHFGHSVENVRYFVQDVENYQNYKPIYQYRRIVWRNVSNINLRRRMYVALIDPGIATVNSLNYLTPYKYSDSCKESNSLEFLSKDTLIYLTGMLGSLVAEYIIRLFSTNNNLNQYLIQNLPIPFYVSTIPLHRELVRQLNTFFPSANKWAKLMSTILHQADKKEKLERTYWNSLAQLDGIMMHIYKVTEPEMELILHRFEKLDNSYKNLVRKFFHSVLRQKHI